MLVKSQHWSRRRAIREANKLRAQGQIAYVTGPHATFTHRFSKAWWVSVP